MLRHHRYHLPPVVEKLASLAIDEARFVQHFLNIRADYGEDVALEELAEHDGQASGDSWGRHLVGLALNALTR